MLWYYFVKYIYVSICRYARKSMERHTPTYYFLVVKFWVISKFNIFNFSHLSSSHFIINTNWWFIETAKGKDSSYSLSYYCLSVEGKCSFVPGRRVSQVVPGTADRITWGTRKWSQHLLLQLEKWKETAPGGREPWSQSRSREAFEPVGRGRSYMPARSCVYSGDPSYLRPVLMNLPIETKVLSWLAASMLPSFSVYWQVLIKV